MDSPCFFCRFNCDIKIVCHKRLTVFNNLKLKLFFFSSITYSYRFSFQTFIHLTIDFFNRKILFSPIFSCRDILDIACVEFCETLGFFFRFSVNSSCIRFCQNDSIRCYPPSLVDKLFFIFSFQLIDMLSLNNNISSSITGFLNINRCSCIIR